MFKSQIGARSTLKFIAIKFVYWHAFDETESFEHVSIFLTYFI